MAFPPLIGITCDVSPNADPTKGDVVRQNLDYASRVSSAGGLAVNLPPIDHVADLAERLDGLLIPGGPDIDPKNYGVQLTKPEMDKLNIKLVSQARFEFEKALYDEMRRMGKPILGICYGCQFINVMEGGTLHPDLKTAMPKTIKHRPDLVNPIVKHPVCIINGSFLHSIVQSDKTICASTHHQAVNKIAPGIKASAFAKDGVIEALEAENGTWLLGLQWHPERTPKTEATKRLFSAFIQQAGGVN